MAGKSYQVGFVFGAKKASSFDGTFKSIGSSIKGIGNAIAGVAGAYVGLNALKGAVDTFATFEQSMAGVKAVSGATANDMKAMEQAALDLKNARPAEGAEALGYMAAAGWDVQKSIAGLGPMINLAKAGELDLATASDLATSSMAAMGVEVKDMTVYLDKATKAGAASNASTQQMLEAYTNVGGKLKSMNVGLEESGALLGVMANRGLRGSEAGNSLNAILTNITQTTGSSAKAMKALGVSAFEGGEFKGAEAVFTEIQQALSGLSQEQQIVYKDMIAGKNNASGFNAILSGMADEYKGLKAEISDADGAMAEMAGIMGGTMKGSMERLGAATDKLKIQVVKTFSGPMTKAIDWAAEKIPAVTQKITSGIQKIGIRAAPAFKYIKDSGAAAITFIKGKWDQYGPSIIAFVVKAKDKAVSAFTWIKDTGQRAIAGIQDKYIEIKPHINDFIGAVIDIGSNIKDKLQGAFEIARPAIEWVATEGFPAVVGTAGDVLGKISDVYNFFKDNWNAISPIVWGIVGAFGAYKAITLGIAAVEAVKTAAMVAATAVTTGLTWAQAALNAVFIASPIGWIVLGIGALIAVGVLLYKNWDVIKAKAIELWNGLKGAFSSAVGWFRGIWDGVTATFQTFMDGISQKFPMLADLTSVPINAIKGHIDGLKMVFTGVIDFVAGVFTDDWTRAWEGVKGIFGGIFSGLTALVKAPLNGIISLVNKAISGINSLSVSIPTGIPFVGGTTIGFNIPQIPMLAEGGIATKPTFAMVGEGRENEAIMPLSKLQDMLNFNTGPMAALIEKFLSLTGGGGHSGGSGSESVQFVYNPQNVFHGAVDRDMIESVQKDDYNRFVRFVKQYERDKKRKGLKT